MDELIEDDNADSHKAINFKKVISKTIDNQIRGIFRKCNIPEFTKGLKTADDQEFTTQLSTVLSSSLSNADAGLLTDLMNITSHYFKKDADEMSKREVNIESGE